MMQGKADLKIERRGGPRPGSGRLKTLGAVRKTVSLDEGTIKKGKTIGGGELSRGIRRAVADFPLPGADSGAEGNESAQAEFLDRRL